MRKLLCLIALSVIISVNATTAQVRLRANALGWTMAIANVGAEVGLTKRLTFVAEGYYSPFWNLKDFRLRGWMVTPELRYYFCEKFNKHYIGLHGNVGNFSRLQPSSLFNIREGSVAGAGLTYGHQWIFNHHWSFDLYGGVGWWRINGDVYCKCEPDFKIHDNVVENKFGLSRLGATFAYRF